jgi:cobyrinic acid a,c-diamide synthase
MDQTSVVQCSALFISATSSGQGKTTVTAGLARMYKNLGLQVAVFKTGPDFLDPSILNRAIDAPVFNLDLWMVVEHRCRELIYQAAKTHDILLIEGVMGLFDGTPSGADLAELFGIPVMAIIDASAMAQTFAAMAYGLQHYKPNLPFAGVMANKVGSDRHADILKDAIDGQSNWFGALKRDACYEIPSRHLGLLSADEVECLDEKLDKIAHDLSVSIGDFLPKPILIQPPSPVRDLPQEPALTGLTVAIAKDEAFRFIYRDNIELLETLGAKVCFFSPLHDQAIPKADVIYLPGGYPELFAKALSENTPIIEQLRDHVNHNKRVIAECGGMIYLSESITTVDGITCPMTAVIPGTMTMQKRLVSLGMQSWSYGDLPPLRGHTFHHSTFETPLIPWKYAINHRVKNKSDQQGEAIYKHGSVIASYLHMYWFSSPTLLIELLR